MEQLGAVTGGGGEREKGRRGVEGGESLFTPSGLSVVRCEIAYYCTAEVCMGAGIHDVPAMEGGWCRRNSCPLCLPY